MKKLAGLFLLSLIAPVFAETFSIAVIPDPQTYSKFFPEIFYAQTEWIAESRFDYNTVATINEGDNVHFGVNEPEQWEVASGAMGVLDGVMPYIMTVGNHDMGIYDRPTAYGRDTTMFNEYFPVSRYEKYSWYGGHAENDNDNSYIMFEVDSIRFLVLTLEFGPNDSELQWANDVVANHPDRYVIVVTHAYLDTTGYLLADEPGGVDRYKLADANGGAQIWKKFVSLHSNIHMVLCGHFHSPYADDCGRHYVHVGVNGNEVHEIYSNFQSYMDLESGFLRMMEFDTKKDTVFVWTYSPWLDELLESPTHEFQFSTPLGEYRRTLNQSQIPSANRFVADPSDALR